MSLLKSKNNKGFTIIELMVVVAVVAVLAAIALPSYGSYVKKSRAQTAGADLVALSAAIESIYQRALTYPAGSGNASTYLSTNSGPAWVGAEQNNFNYTVTVSGSAYTLTATGKSNMAGCQLTLTQANVRTVSGGDKCGGISAW